MSHLERGLQTYAFLNLAKQRLRGDVTLDSRHFRTKADKEM